jgi:hypothetical protein
MHAPRVRIDGSGQRYGGITRERAKTYAFVVKRSSWKKRRSERRAPFEEQIITDKPKKNESSLNNEGVVEGIGFHVGSRDPVRHSKSRTQLNRRSVKE